MSHPERARLTPKMRGKGMVFFRIGKIIFEKMFLAVKIVKRKGSMAAIFSFFFYFARE
jgi:hypothetical protein